MFQSRSWRWVVLFVSSVSGAFFVQGSLVEAAQAVTPGAIKEVIPNVAQASTAKIWRAWLDAILAKHPDVVSAKEKLLAAQANHQAALSGFLPQVSSTGSGTYSGGGASSGAMSYAASVQVGQSLFAGFEDQLKRDRTELQMKLAEVDFEKVKSQVEFEAKNGAIEWQYAKDAVRVAQSVLKRREKNADLVSLRFESGRENKGSALLSKAYLAQANLEKFQAENLVRIARAHLAKTIQSASDLNEEAELGEIPEFTSSAVSPVKADFQMQLLSTSEVNAIASHHFDFQRSQLSTAVSEVDLSLTKKNFYPTLGLAGSLGRVGPTFFPENTHWSVGLNLTIPIYNGGRDFQGFAAAQSMARAAHADEVGQVLDLRSMIIETHVAWTESAQKLKVAENFYLAASLRAEVARERYANGLASFEDWDLVENDLIQREKTQITAKKDLLMAESKWQREARQ